LNPNPIKDSNQVLYYHYEKNIMFNKILVVEDFDSVSTTMINALKELSITEIHLAKYCDEADLKVRKKLLNKKPFDFLICDLSFKNDHFKNKLNSGEELIAAIRKVQPDIKIEVFSVEDKSLVIPTLAVVNYLNSKNKRDKIKTTIETENRISKKLHDEVANDLYQVIVFAETQDLGANENKELLLSNLRNIYNATRNISREISPLIKGADFEKEIKELLNGFDSTTVNILVNGLEKVDWTLLDNIKKLMVYRALQELLINMKKHSNCSLVMLIFKKNKNNLEINYSDNGAGAPIEKIILGNGLQNVRNRIRDVNGNITFETEPNKGFKSSIVLPLYKKHHV